jgi:DNA-binding MarR family transcriptional regulator
MIKHEKDIFKLGSAYQLLSVIQYLNEPSITEVYKKTMISMSCVIKSIRILHDKGFIKVSMKDKRRKKVVLTSKGVKIASYVNLLMQELKEMK